MNTVVGSRLMGEYKDVVDSGDTNQLGLRPSTITIEIHVSLPYATLLSQGFLLPSTL